MSVNEIALYELLKSKIGEKEAQAFVQVLETKVENKLADKTAVFSTKEDLANMKVELIKWMFIFWIGQLVVFIGIAQFIIK